MRKLTTDNAVSAEDMRAILAAGVSRQQIEDARTVCFSFNTTKLAGRRLRILNSGS